jgi:hypothetical protein
MPRRQLASPTPSGKFRHDSPVLRLSKGAQRLGADIALGAKGEGELRQRGVVGQLGDGDGIVLAYREIERLQLAAGLPVRFLCLVEPRGALLNGCDALLGEA